MNNCFNELHWQLLSQESQKGKVPRSVYDCCKPSEISSKHLLPTLRQLESIIQKKLHETFMVCFRTYFARDK